VKAIIFIIPAPALAMVHGPPLGADVVPSSVQTYQFALVLAPSPRAGSYKSAESPLDGTVARILCHISMARFCVSAVDVGQCAICRPLLEFGGAPLSIVGSLCVTAFP
jgi:hypothetical protein